MPLTHSGSIALPSHRSLTSNHYVKTWFLHTPVEPGHQGFVPRPSSQLYTQPVISYDKLNSCSAN